MIQYNLLQYNTKLNEGNESHRVKQQDTGINKTVYCTFIQGDSSYHSFLLLSREDSSMVSVSTNTFSLKTF